MMCHLYAPFANPAVSGGVIEQPVPPEQPTCALVYHLRWTCVPVEVNTSNKYQVASLNPVQLNVLSQLVNVPLGDNGVFPRMLAITFLSPFITIDNGFVVPFISPLQPVKAYPT